MNGRPERQLPDKQRLIGGCTLLPLRVDGDRLATEVDGLGPGVWGTAAGRVGVHSAAEAVFLRGHAPAEGDLPIEDRPILDRLPYAREILGQLGDQPRRCLLARLPPGAERDLTLRAADTLERIAGTRPVGIRTGGSESGG